MDFALTDLHVGWYRGDELVRVPLTCAAEDMWPAALFGSLHLVTDQGAITLGRTPGALVLDPWLLGITSKPALLAQHDQAFWDCYLDEETSCRFEKDGSRVVISWAGRTVRASFGEFLDAVERFLAALHDRMLVDHPVAYRRLYRMILRAYFLIDVADGDPRSEPDLRRLRDMPVTWKADLWTRDVPTVLTPENMGKIREALSRGFGCGYHGIFCGGCSPTYWVATNPAELDRELASSRPGDAYEIWASGDLEKSGLVLAHDKGNGPLLGAAAVKHVEAFVGVEYNEVMGVMLTASGASLMVRDKDGWDELASSFAMVTADQREVFVFNFTGIGPEHALVSAKYPDDRGFVPVGGAY